MAISIQGRKPVSKQDDKTYIQAPITRPWTYIHDPMSWFFDDKAGWLPLLGEISSTQGCNGVTSDGLGGVNINAPLTVAATNGKTVIRVDDKRLRPEYRPYYLEYDCIEGSGGRGKIGIHVRSIFESATQIGRTTLWERDDGMFTAFLLSLIEDGIVEPMAPEVLTLALANQQETINRAGMNPSPYFVDKVKAEKARIKHMQKLYGERFTSPLSSKKLDEASDEPEVQPEAQPPVPVPVKGRKPQPQPPEE